MGRVGYPVQLYSGTATETGNTQSTPVNTKFIQEAIFFLDITAVSGTDPTLDVIIQVYNTLANKWGLLATFTQRSAVVVSDVGMVQYGLGEKVAITYTIGGTDPSFTFSLNASFK